MLRIGLPLDRRFLDARAFGRTVAALGAIGRSAVHFHKLRIVDIRPERAFDGFKIGAMAIRSQLDPIVSTAEQKQASVAA